MAKEVITNGFISVNGVNLSDHASSIAVPVETDDVEVTSFGAQNKEHAKGLGDATIDVDFFQDYAVASVHATLWPISQSKTPVPIVVRKDAAVVSATNPQWTMQGLLMNYSPIEASIGEANTMSVSFVNGSQSGLVQTIS